VKVLGIETSCDETAAAIVEDGRRTVAHVVASQMDIHAAFGGVVPEVASRQHVEVISHVVSATMHQANMDFSDLDGIAVTCGPGLLGALLVGVSAAKGYALATGLPLIGVHHIAGHVAAAALEVEGLVPGKALGVAPVTWPALALVVSGGHTEILLVDASFRFTRLGGTKDDAAGEAYDKVARLLGLGYPGGPKVDALAAIGNPKAYAFPRALLDDPGYDFSFSGLKSSVNNALQKQRHRAEEIVLADVCASFQQAVLDVVIEKTARAVSETGLRTVVVAGGVAANKGLRTALQNRAKADGFAVYFPPISLCTDNGAMIAAAGCLLLGQGRTTGLDLNAYANLPLATWQNF